MLQNDFNTNKQINIPCFNHLVDSNMYNIPNHWV